MGESLTVREYFTGPEELRRRELVWGTVREPPAPRFGHQAIVTRTTVILDLHVRAHELGVVCVSPVDVVLDEAHALVVQPDVIFISKERETIVREQVWGAPDLVVEVASRGTAIYDRSTKLGWYRTHSVRECWLIDPAREAIVLVDFTANGRRGVQRFTGPQQLRSSVLPGLRTEAHEFFD